MITIRNNTKKAQGHSQSLKTYNACHSLEDWSIQDTSLTPPTSCQHFDCQHFDAWMDLRQFLLCSSGCCSLPCTLNYVWAPPSQAQHHFSNKLAALVDPCPLHPQMLPFVLTVSKAAPQGSSLSWTLGYNPSPTPPEAWSSKLASIAYVLTRPP